MRCVAVQQQTRQAHMAQTVLAAIDGVQAFIQPEGQQWPSTNQPLITYLDPNEPAVNVFNLSVIRGDGIFEATSAVGDCLLALELHQQRLANSARLSDLPVPNKPVLNEALTRIYQHYRTINGPDAGEAHIRWLISRGADGSTTPGKAMNPGVPNIWAYVDERMDDPLNPAPLRLISLPKGVSSDAAQEYPWMLWGAKTLSYAMNMAAYREAARRGADNVVFTSTEGNLLEGPTSSIAWLEGNTLCTPTPDQGILYGTTQRELFAFAAHRGLETRYGRFDKSHLDSADIIVMLGGSYVFPVATYNGKTLGSAFDFAVEANDFMRTQREYINAYTSTHTLKIQPAYGEEH